MRKGRPDRSDFRWTEALNLLHHTGNAATKRHLRHQRRTSLFIVAGLVLVLALGTRFLGSRVTQPGRHATHRHFSHPPVWQGALGLALSVCGLALLILGMVKRLRSGGFLSDWSAPIVVLSQSQRRLLVRQATGKVPADPELLPLARDVARRLVRAERLSRFGVGGVALGLIGQVLLLARLPFALVAGGFLLVLAIAARLAHKRAGRAELFLRNHPPAEAEQAIRST